MRIGCCVPVTYVTGESWQGWNKWTAFSWFPNDELSSDIIWWIISCKPKFTGTAQLWCVRKLPWQQGCGSWNVWGSWEIHRIMGINFHFWVIKGGPGPCRHHSNMRDLGCHEYGHEEWEPGWRCKYHEISTKNLSIQARLQSYSLKSSCVLQTLFFLPIYHRLVHPFVEAGQNTIIA